MLVFRAQGENSERRTRISLILGTPRYFLVEGRSQRIPDFNETESHSDGGVEVHVTGDEGVLLAALSVFMLKMIDILFFPRFKCCILDSARMCTTLFSPFPSCYGFCCLLLLSMMCTRREFRFYCFVRSDCS